jgi:hypothetical protein
MHSESMAARRPSARTARIRANGAKVVVRVDRERLQLADERLLDPCPNSVIPPHRQRFTMTSAESQQITLAPEPENRPPADLLIEGDLTASTPTLRLSWHRGDYPAPLDWRGERAAALEMSSDDPRERASAVS